MTARLIDLRQYPALHDAALSLNAANAIETSPLDADGLLRRLSRAAAAPALVEGDGLLGFVLAYGSEAGPDSRHYDWVAGRLSCFVYIDRVITAAPARGRGIGRGLYEAVENLARARGAAWLACEINVEPPNPVSDAFHARLGFETMGRAVVGNGKTVRYVRRAVA